VFYNPRPALNLCCRRGVVSWSVHWAVDNLASGKDWQTRYGKVLARGPKVPELVVFLLVLAMASEGPRQWRWLLGLKGWVCS
jgi:hypothetical protein